MTESNTVQHQNVSKTRHQNGTKKNYNTPSQMLLDHCYTFGLLLWHSNSEEVVLWRRALIDLLWPCPRSITVRMWPKSQYKLSQKITSWVLLRSIDTKINQKISKCEITCTSFFSSCIVKNIGMHYQFSSPKWIL